jgi:glycosyltransferase involved in cell wall biosynthesis
MSSVDVVIPCYRYGCFLRECVESVISQIGVSVRVLIIDDASPDNSAEIAAKLSSESSLVSVIRHSVNKGHIATYNEGIEWTEADYYMILSADDYLLPGALLRAAELMDREREVGFTYGKAITLDMRGGIEPLALKTGVDDWCLMSGTQFIRLAGARNIVPTPTAVVRTSLQKSLGGYRRELPHSGDMEMWLRLAAHGSVARSDAYQAVYRRHSHNMSSQYMKDHWFPDLKQRKAAFSAFLDACETVVPEPDKIKEQFCSLLAIDALGCANAAFNSGDPDLSRRLSGFAKSECKAISRSIHWTKLSVKRRLGFTRWQALKRAFDRFPWRTIEHRSIS